MELIEFFGIPGSGKSYMAASMYPGELHFSLKKNIFLGINFSILFKVFLVCSHPLITLKCSLFMLKYSDMFLRIPTNRLIKVLFNWFYIASIFTCLSKRNSHRVVLDQGVLQAIFSNVIISDSAIYLQHLQFFLDDFLVLLHISSWKIFIVHAEKSIIERRILARQNQSPLDNDIALFTNATLIVDTISHYLDNPSNFSFIKVPIQVNHIIN